MLSLMLFAVVAWCTFGVACYVTATNRGANGCLYGILGVLFGPFALLAVLLLEGSRCARCQKSISAKAAVCPYCRFAVVVRAPASPNAINEPAEAEESVRKRRRFAKRLAAVYVTILVVVIASFAFAFSKQSANQKRFFSETLDYFRALAAIGDEVTQRMAHVQNSNLDSLKKVLLTAQSTEASVYARYSKSIEGTGVPDGTGSVSGNTDYVHSEFQKSLSEFLQYWEDGKLAHIVSGGDDLKQSLAEADTTVTEIRRLR